MHNPTSSEYRRSMMKTPMLVSSLAALVLTAGAAQAQVVNGDFAGGLTGWTIAGDAKVTGGVLSLTNAYTDALDGPFNLSGQPAVWIGDVEVAAGAAPLALDLVFPDAGTEGSTAQQSFTVTAGQQLNFSWSFGTLETSFLDHAFVVIDGQVTTLATRTSAPSGLQSFSHVFTQGGTVSLAFGVVDTGDVLGVSTLNISDVNLTAAVPVPEPAPAAMLLAGLGVMGLLVKRRRAG